MIPLGVHSHYSLLRSPTSCEALCRQAKKSGYAAIALTDINNLYGMWDFINTCYRHDLRPIIGAEIRTADERVFCLVKNNVGYVNLCRLLTDINLDKKQKQKQKQKKLQKVPEHKLREIILLTDSRKMLDQWKEMELDIGAAVTGRPTRKTGSLRAHADRLGIPAVAVADSYVLTDDERKTQQLLRAIAANSSLSCPPGEEQAGVENFFLFSPQQYKDRFGIWPEIIKNTHAVAERCAFRRPEFGLVLPPYNNLSPEKADEQLRQAALQGAGNRYGTPLPQKVIKRLNYELQVIADMGFSSYFLVVRDIVKPVSRTCGRGSGAASLVSYCLRITNVCPIRHNLYFERFLNPGRKDVPDIDIDFAWDERDRVLDSLFSKYGRHCAMVSNLITMQPRKAIRETAKVFGIPAGEINRLTRRLSGFHFNANSGETLLRQLLHTPSLRRCLFINTPPWPEILHHAQGLISTPAALSVHSGGIIITPRPVSDYVPVQRANKGVPVIQWDKDGARQAGLVKIDLLGNRSLGVIRDALSEVRAGGGRLDEHRWRPEEDGKTRELVKAGKTMGCFYIESPAMRLLQQKAGRGDFKHLVIHSSIIRPAANDCIREYLRRLHGGCRQSLPPLVDTVLKETYGIMVYQEDVSRVAVKLGFSPEEADRLRKIMAQKDKPAKPDQVGRPQQTHETEKISFQRRFFQAAAEKNIAAGAAADIWRMMQSFAGYSFCKPHSASYARVSFQAAYLKAHYPAEFMAAVISNQGGFYSTFAYVSEARRMGLRILPPHVNASEIAWRGRKKEVRVGLTAIAGLSDETCNRIVQQQKEKRFTSILDFLQRVRPAENEAKALIHAGGLDGLEKNKTAGRNEMLYRLAHWQQNRSSGISRLFAPCCRPPALPEQDRITQLRNEYRVLGFLCRMHPIQLFDRQRQRLRSILACDLKKMIDTQQTVRFAGWPVTGKIVGTKSGKPMEFLTFEDETGLVECTIFPHTYQKYCHLLHKESPLLLTGVVEQDFGALSLTVSRVKALNVPDRTEQASLSTLQV